MDDSVDVTIKVDAELAGMFKDARNREWAGRMVSRALRPEATRDQLAVALAATQAAAREAGLMDEDVDAELAAYNAERRS